MRTTGEHISLEFNGQLTPLNKLTETDILNDALDFARIEMKLRTLYNR